MYDSVFMEEATVSKNWNCTHIDVSDKVYHLFLFGCKCFTVCAAYMSKDCFLVYFGFFEAMFTFFW